MQTGFTLAFERQYLQGAVIVSLLSVWVLVALFCYLNRYTKRYYFTIWTAAWLFYALWLTLGIVTENPPLDSYLFSIRLWCVGVSALFLLWGGLQFIGKPTHHRLFGCFIVFLLVWSLASPRILGSALLVQIPVFLLIGLASMFAGLSFYDLHRRQPFVGIGLLFLGFVLWGGYLITYPFAQGYDSLSVVGFLVSAVLQLFIAVSMIVLVLEEVRYTQQNMLQQIQTVNSEKEALQAKVLSTEATCRSLFDQARLHKNLQQAYDELRQTQHAVVQQERLVAVGHMASGMAHDINNAISPILAFSELVLQREESLSEMGRKYLGYIGTAAEDIAQIVARMRDFYRRQDQPGQLRLLQVNKVLSEVVELTRPRWRDMAQNQGVSIQVKTELAHDLPDLYGNESELREGITNVILNSIDALPKGGQITVSSWHVTLNGNLHQPARPDHIIITVKDNGVGMDEQTRRHCVEPFFSTKRQRGGTGLGLAMVYGMMERHEGRIEIESALDHGTTIRLIFPLRTAATTESKPEAPRSTPTGLRILCVDDEPLLREMLREMLVGFNNRVVTAGDGRTGLDIFQEARKRGEPFDVVITDLGMPEVDGGQVAEAVKQSSPKTPVIMLTGWGNVLEEHPKAAQVVDTLLTKPPRTKDITDALSKLVPARNN